jgi:hypothetical protein
MGTIYSVACKKCKVVRNLDKFYTPRKIADRAEALQYSEEVETDSFRAGLLPSFMSEHQGHDCVFFSEHDAVSDELDPYENENGYKEDRNFWKEG